MWVASIAVVIAWAPYDDSGYPVIAPMILAGLAVMGLASWTAARIFLRVEMTEKDGNLWSSAELAPEKLMGFRPWWLYGHSLILALFLGLLVMGRGAVPWFIAVPAVALLGLWIYIDVTMIRRLKQGDGSTPDERG